MWSDEEKKELIRLLQKVKADGGYWPDEATTRAAHGAISHWAADFIVLRDNPHGSDKEILLTVYDGGAEKHHGMWHVPGGYNRWDESIQETVSRVAKRELGVDAHYEGVLGADKWEAGEHQYGRPLSLYMKCELAEPIHESDTLKFFPLERLPENMVSAHKRFISRAL